MNELLCIVGAICCIQALPFVIYGGLMLWGAVMVNDPDNEDDYYDWRNG